MDTDRPVSPVFAELQAQKRASVDALRCVFGGGGVNLISAVTH